MGLTDRIRAHPVVAWLGILGSVASIVALALWFYKPEASSERPGVEADLHIEAIEQSSRGPVWGNEFFGDDEIVVRVTGTANAKCEDCAGAEILGFWRLASGHETNWHVARRRVGGNYRLATVPGATARAGRWDALFGGIECDKTYAGDIAFVLMAFPTDYIQRTASSWLNDNLGWGFEDLPGEEVLATSTIRTIRTSPVR